MYKIHITGYVMDAALMALSQTKSFECRTEDDRFIPRILKIFPHLRRLIIDTQQLRPAGYMPD